MNARRQTKAQKKIIGQTLNGVARWCSKLAKHFEKDGPKIPEIAGATFAMKQAAKRLRKEAKKYQPQTKEQA